MNTVSNDRRTYGNVASSPIKGHKRLHVPKGWHISDHQDGDLETITIIGPEVSTTFQLDTRISNDLTRQRSVNSRVKALRYDAIQAYHIQDLVDKIVQAQMSEAAFEEIKALAEKFKAESLPWKFTPID